MPVPEVNAFIPIQDIGGISGKTSRGRTYTRRSVLERLSERVNFLGPVPGHNPSLGSCWVWTGGLNKGGYATILGEESRSSELIHRVSFRLHHGPIQDGLVIDHLCRNRACCNPSHLRQVSHRENILCGTGASARQSRKTHCKRGHEFTPDNTIIKAATKRNPLGTRRCLECQRAEGRSRYSGDGRASYLEYRRKLHEKIKARKNA